MKKILSILLVLIMLMTSMVCLSGCASDKEDEDKDTKKSSSKVENKKEDEEEEEEEEVSSDGWSSKDFAKIGLDGVKRLEGYTITNYEAYKYAIEVEFKADGGTAKNVEEFAQKLFDLTDNYSGEITEEFTIELTGEINTLEEATLINYDEYVSFWWYYKYEGTTYQVLISGDSEEASISIMDAGI